MKFEGGSVLCSCSFDNRFSSVVKFEGGSVLCSFDNRSSFSRWMLRQRRLSWLRCSSM